MQKYLLIMLLSLIAKTTFSQTVSVCVITYRYDGFGNRIRRENSCNPLAGASLNNPHLPTDTKRQAAGRDTSKANIASGFEEAKMWPNPTSGPFSIRLESTVADIEVQVLDVTGKLVASRQASAASQIDLDIEFAPSGTYLIIMTAGSRRETFKLIKQQ